MEASDLVILPIWVGGLSQLLGMPVAWLRLRRTKPWIERPTGVRRIDLLAAYLKPVTALAIGSSLLFGVLFYLIWSATGESSDSGWVIAALVLLFGLPLLFAPWAAARIEPSRLGELEAYEEAAARAP